jgi:DtxR family Mn-dependent transcriptional regulator
MAERVTEEMLEAIWTCQEQGQATVAGVLEACHAEAGRDVLQRMIGDGLVQQLEGDRLQLTDAGRKAAAPILRHHRLAERLLADVLGVPAQKMEELACHFEHMVLPEVAEGLCTLLGHPRECPHGKPIPPGRCCREGLREVPRSLMPLSEAPCGRGLRVAYLRTRNHDRLHLLLSLGLGPGVALTIHQRTPVLVVQVDQSEFALDHEVAEDVYAWLEPEEDKKTSQ